MRISLRLKLILLSLLLLAIPYTGIRLSAIIQASLVESREEALMFSARAFASALSGRKGLFDQERFHSLDQRRDLYLFHLTNPMRLNGKSDDWAPYLQNGLRFGKEHILNPPGKYKEGSSGFTHLIGKRGEFLYAIFIVDDDQLVFKKKNALALDQSDHLQIGIEDPQGNLNRYIVATEKAGWTNGYLISRDFENIFPARSESQIKGVLEPTATGYILEIRFPLTMVGDRLAFAIGDVDNSFSREIETIIGTASIDNPEQIGWLLEQSTLIEEILQSLNRPQSKIQVVDSNQHVRASFGSLRRSEELEKPESTSIITKLNTLLRPLYRLFADPFTTDFPDPEAQPTTLDIQGLREALSGTSSISRYRIADKQVEVMAAITPLYEENKIMGAVVVEQTTNSILALKNRVLEESFGLALLVLVFGGFGLFFFAFRVSSRIGQLRNQAAHAIGENGQILEVSPASRARDEIGDLSRTLHAVLSQLKAQSTYREKMADNLEHEMRTPLASVSASLKNLANELPNAEGSVQSYLNWALGDIQRMEDLLTAIRDATSLKNAITQDFKEHFNLAEAVAVWLKHSWKETFKDVDFIYKQPKMKVDIFGDPDRIRQMLDKLIENSVAFHTDGTAIELIVSSTPQFQEVKVINQGPAIPEDMLEEIFNTMVSVRASGDERPHLGLGLFIVRTIVQHHGGSVQAENLKGETARVCFTITLPNPVAPIH